MRAIPFTALLNNIAVPTRIGILDPPARQRQDNQQRTADHAVPSGQRRGNAAEQGEQTIESFLVIDPAGFLDGDRGLLRSCAGFQSEDATPITGTLRTPRLAIA
jgi:hypothetical protein